MFDAEEFLTDWAGVKIDMEYRAMANAVEAELEHRDPSETAHIIAALWWHIKSTASKRSANSR